MKILALEPYYGGSHRAFLDGWSSHSRHHWTVEGLPPSKWKWRMRHSAITFSEIVNRRIATGESWNLLFCSDMLNLAEFKGLVDSACASLPTVVYFHENQLTYPVQTELERDLHFPLTNFTTALAADSVWFNSAFHRDSFFDALPLMLKKMPDYQSLESVEPLRDKCLVMTPGIERPRQRVIGTSDYSSAITNVPTAPTRVPTAPTRVPTAPTRVPTAPKVPKVLWAARWEHDKNPEMFFKAISTIRANGIYFRLNVIGQKFARVPDIFEKAKHEFADCIDVWGYRESRSEYEQVLRDSDIFVSTADHEFFGITVVEAVAAGLYPVLPRKLSYPELLGLDDNPEVERFFYDGGLSGLISRLTAVMERAQAGTLWADYRSETESLIEKYFWDKQAGVLDNGVEEVAARQDSAGTSQQGRH